MDHLERFFCESGKEDKIISDDIFIVSGERWQELLYQNDNESMPRTWDSYKNCQSIVLLGLPRQGKTTEFLYQCKQLKNGFYLPLSDVPTMGSLEGFELTIEDFDRWQKWRSGEECGELFIDSLDEGKLAIPTFMRNLAAWLRSLNPILWRLRVHLSCRGAEWDRVDQDTWFKLFKFSEDFQEYEENDQVAKVLVLLDLTRSQYEKYCQAHGVDPEQLLNDLPIRARRFVARPQTLKMIVENYHQSGRLPETITELFERIIEKRLGEDNPDRQQAPRIIPIINKRSVAELYAAITVLSGRPLISGQDTISLNSVPMGIGEHLHKIEEATFNSGLFQSPLRGQYRFDDLELTNYLGASYLNGLINEGKITVSRAIHLFLANPEEMEPIPKLRGMFVWLCALNPKFRHSAVNVNPGILLDDFPVDLTVDDKLIAWKWLVKRYGDRNFFDYRPWVEGVKALACLEIVPFLEEVLQDQAKYGRDIRSLALEIALAGNLIQLGSTIELCCQNSKDDPYFLTDAAAVLMKLSSERIEVLKPWLNLPTENDPNNRLLGSALKILWPNHISIQDLVGYLRPPLIKDGSDGIFGFLYYLSDKLSTDERGVVIESMAKELEMILQKKYEERPQTLDHLPSQWIMKFLIPQVRAWKNDSKYLPKLEKWITIALKAKEASNIYFPDHDKFTKLIRENRILRHSLEVRRIQRACDEKGDEFDPRKYDMGGIYFPDAEDLAFWKETFLSWLNGDPRMVEVAWNNLYTSWNQSDYSSEFVIWVEDLSEKNVNVKHLWDNSKSWKMQDWHRERKQREKKQAESRQKNKKYILENKSLLADGDFDLLVDLYYFSGIKNKSIEEEYGDEVASAFRAGLLAFWQNSTLPALTEYYTNNSIPWKVLLMLKAVNVWIQEARTPWVDVSKSMRHTAIQAGLSDNKFPDWYEDLVQIESEAFREIAFEALELEKNSNNSPILARRLNHNGSLELFRKIAFDYLEQNPTMRSEVVLPLAEAQCTDNPAEDVVDYLWELGRRRLTEIGRRSGLSIMALVWHYKAEVVWSWLNDNFLGIGEARTECFKDWLNAISAMHVSHSIDKWPGWVKPVALMNLLPDYFASYPPETDPTIEEINKNIPAIQHRRHLTKLRNDALAKIAESGSVEAGKFLTEWAADPERRQYRDHILYYFDVWHLATTEKGWQPLSPQDLMGVLTQGLRPIRNHAELYDLVFEMIIAIKADFEGGEGNLKDLLWDKSDPAPETKLQILLAQGIRQHPLRSKVVGNREVVVSGENRPDVKIETMLENGQTCIMYIEVKRQKYRVTSDNYEDIFTAVESQLANKYLIEPQARYGIYFVGWYGKDHWGSVSKKTIRKNCYEIPVSAADLEVCLQQIADEVVKNGSGIDGIKVVVADLSL